MALTSVKLIHRSSFSIQIKNQLERQTLTSIFSNLESSIKKLAQARIHLLQVSITCSNQVVVLRRSSSGRRQRTIWAPFSLPPPLNQPTIRTSFRRVHLCSNRNKSLAIFSISALHQPSQLSNSRMQQEWTTTPMTFLLSSSSRRLLRKTMVEGVFRTFLRSLMRTNNNNNISRSLLQTWGLTSSSRRSQRLIRMTMMGTWVVIWMVTAHKWRNSTKAKDRLAQWEWWACAKAKKRKRDLASSRCSRMISEIRLFPPTCTPQTSKRRAACSNLAMTSRCKTWWGLDYLSNNSKCSQLSRTSKRNCHKSK